MTTFIYIFLGLIVLVSILRLGWMIRVLTRTLRLPLLRTGVGRVLGNSGGSQAVTEWPLVLRRGVEAPNKGLPALATSLGLLGTFWGMAKGLPDLNVTDSALFMDKAQSFVGSMGVAFDTSLYGIGIAAAIMACNFLFIAYFTWLRTSRDKALRREFKLVHATDLLAAADPEAQGRAAQALAEAGQSMGGASQAMAQAAAGFSAESIAEQVGDAVSDSIEDSLAPVFTEIRDELKALREIKADQGQAVLERLVRALRTDVLEPMAGELQGQRKATETLTSGVQKLLGGVEQLMGGLNTVNSNLKLTIDHLDTFQRRTLTELRGFSGDLKATLSTFVADATASFEGLSAEVARSVDHAKEGMEAQRLAFKESAQLAADRFERAGEIQTAQIDRQHQAQQEAMARVNAKVERAVNAAVEGMTVQRAAFEENARTAAEAFRGVREELIQVIEAQHQTQRAAFEQMDTQMRAVSEAAQAKFAESFDLLKATAEEGRNLLTTASDEVERGLRQVPEMLTQISEETQGQLTAFRESYEAQVDKFLRDQNALLADTLGEYRDGLAQVVSDLNHEFKSEAERRAALNVESAELLRKLSDGADKVSELHERLELNKVSYIEGLRETSELQMMALEEFTKIYKQSGEQQHGAMETLFNDFHTRLEDFDEVSGKTARGLSGLANQMLQTLNDLSGQAQRIAEHRG